MNKMQLLLLPALLPLSIGVAHAVVDPDEAVELPGSTQDSWAVLPPMSK
jgi:hypothetical protein